MELDSQIKKTYKDGQVVVMKDRYFISEAIEKCVRLNQQEENITYEVVELRKEVGQ